MRVAVLSEAAAGLSPAAAGAAVARAWAARGDQVAVVPLGSAGRTFAAAAAGLPDGVVGAALDDPAPEPDSIDVVASSTPLGLALRFALRGDGSGPERPMSPRPRRVLLDLVGAAAHDGGAGLLGALGATADRPLDNGVAALEGVGTVDLTAALRALDGVELVGVVPAAAVDAQLTGLKGVTSLRGAAARSSGDTGALAALLSTDATLGALAAALGVDPACPGAGACGGAALAVLALGGTLASGPEALAAEHGLPATLAAADLVIAVTDSIDFGDRGGEVVRAATDWAETALRPCIAIVGRVNISSRELRQMGLESAYGVVDAVPFSDLPVATEAELVLLAAKVARTWGW